MIISRTPFRISFFGGGTDFPQWYNNNSGKVISTTKRGVLTRSGIFKIHGERSAWEKHWLNIPPRDYHDIFAMLAKKLITIDGNLTPFMQNLQYFKDLIASNRQSIK